MQKTGFRWENVTVDNITVKPYDSKPYNPDSARVFYRAGFIESWGQGIQKNIGTIYECAKERKKN